MRHTKIIGGVAAWAAICAIAAGVGYVPVHVRHSEVDHDGRCLAALTVSGDYMDPEQQKSVFTFYVGRLSGAGADISMDDMARTIQGKNHLEAAAIAQNCVNEATRMIDETHH